MFCNNATWPASLNAALAAHLSASAPRLAALATVRALPPAALADAGLALHSATGVEVTWDRVGAPLHVYVREGRQGACPPGGRCDGRYAAASEGGVDGDIGMV